GSVTFNTAPASGAGVRIARILDILEPTNYPENTKFPSASHERALDRLTMIDQQQQDAIDDIDSRAIDLRDELAEEVITRSEADDALRSLIGQAGPIEVPVYDTRLAASLAEIKPGIEAIRTGGYSS